MHPFRILPLGRSVRPFGPTARTRRGAVKLRLIVVLLLLGGFVAAGRVRHDAASTPSRSRRFSRKCRTRLRTARSSSQQSPRKRSPNIWRPSITRSVCCDRDPQSTQALLFYGQALVRQERQLEALPYFLRAQDSESDSAAWCHLQAGQILCNQLSKYREGEEQFRRALELQPGEPNATWLLGTVLRLANRTWELIPVELAEIEEKQRLHVQVMDDLSHNLRLAPDADQVLKAIKVSPDDPDVLLGHASLLRMQLKYDEAEADLRKVIEIAPKIDEAQVKLGWVLFESGNDAKFLEWQTKPKGSVTEHPLYWTLCGCSCRAGSSE